MPKNTIIPAAGGPGPAPPVPEQSIRFDQTRATNLRGHFSGNTNLGWSLSFWFKRTGDLGTVQTLFESRIDANNKMRVYFDASDRLNYETTVGGVVVSENRSSRFMRDVTNWYHCLLTFAANSQIRWDINGYILPGIQQLVIATAGNGIGFAWGDSGTEQFVGSNALGAEGFSGQMAEVHMVDVSQGPKVATDFGVFNSRGVWERIVYAGAHGSVGWYLPFSRTIDLGEDFSGNANHFPTHTNGAGAGGDQFNDWTERNYCTLDVHDHRTVGTVTEGGLVVAGGNARVTMRPRFNTGVYYYERNGVGITWDTFVSGEFDPDLTPATYNFGQLAFVGVGPGGGELTVNANNYPATSTDITRDSIASIWYAGNADATRVVTLGEGQSTIVDAEYADILFRCDLAWVKNIGEQVGPPDLDWFQAHRLRNGFQIPINTTGAEESTNINGFISDLPDPGPGVEMTKGGTDGQLVNEFGNAYNIFALHVRNYAQNIIVTANDESDAEEILADGDTDTGSSDLELGSEDGGAGSAEQAVGMHFKNLLIPQGSTVLDAKIQFECDAVRNDQPNDLEIWCEDIDDAPEFVDGAANFNITGRTKTSASTLWSPAQWTAVQQRTSLQLSPNFSGAADEVVNRGGWAPGNDLVAIIEPESGGTVGRHEAESGNAGTPATAVGPELQIKWRDPGVAAETNVSLFTYTGIGKAREIMHGLPDVPELVAVRNLAGGFSWGVYCSTIVTAGAGEDGHLEFDTPDVYAASTYWDNAPAGGLSMRLGPDDAVNETDSEFAGFAISSLPGFSKVFRYLGNGSLDGPLIYLDFKPRFIVIKATGAGTNWVVMHKSASTVTGQNNQYNQMENQGFLNTANNLFQSAEALDAYSSGFKVRSTDSEVNGNLVEYVGFAFAEQNINLAKAAP